MKDPHVAHVLYQKWQINFENCEFDRRPINIPTTRSLARPFFESRHRPWAMAEAPVVNLQVLHETLHAGAFSRTYLAMVGPNMVDLKVSMATQGTAQVARLLEEERVMQSLVQHPYLT